MSCLCTKNNNYSKVDGTELSPDGVVVPVIEEIHGVLKEGRAALPEALRLLTVHVQQLHKRPVALW